DAVRQIVKRIRAIFHRTAAPTPDLSAKTRDSDAGKAPIIRHARVEGIALPIGENVAVEGQKQLPITLVAQPKFVHHGGTGGPYPVANHGPVAYRNGVVEGWIHHGVIFSHAVVVAQPQHAIDHVLAVDAIVHFRHTIVTAVRE